MYIFWDNSNIHISGLKVMETKEPGQPRELFRTDFSKLMQLVSRNRKITDAYLSGSVPPPNNTVWAYLKSIGVNLQLLNKTAEGLEQESVDMSLQTMMYRVAIDNAPSTIAILTGDGAGNQLGEGFLTDLQRVHHKLGCSIEVYAWELSCNRLLKEFAQENGKFVKLEDYYYSITYLTKDRNNPKGKYVRGSAPLILADTV